MAESGNWPRKLSEAARAAAAKYHVNESTGESWLRKHFPELISQPGGRDTIWLINEAPSLVRFLGWDEELIP